MLTLRLISISKSRSSGLICSPTGSDVKTAQKPSSSRVSGTGTGGDEEIGAVASGGSLGITIGISTGVEGLGRGASRGDDGSVGFVLLFRPIPRVLGRPRWEPRGFLLLRSASALFSSSFSNCTRRLEVDVRTGRPGRALEVAFFCARA